MSGTKIGSKNDNYLRLFVPIAYQTKMKNDNTRNHCRNIYNMKYL